MRFRRGRPVKASRYALRASRSVVVSLSLSRRNAASESEKKAVARGSWLVARKTMPHGLVMYITIYSRRAALAGSAPTHKADGRVFLRIAELWQPTFISSPVCDIVGDAQRAYRYGNSAKCCAEKTLFADPSRRGFLQLRVTRSDVVNLSLLPRSGIRRGRPVKASRYALRVSRSVVVSLSLSRRNAAF